MRTRCEACNRTWGAEEPLGLKAEATVASCAWCGCDGFRSRLEERLRTGPTEPTAAREAVLGKLLPTNIYTSYEACAASIEALREAREKIGCPALGSVIFVRQETLDELRKLPVQRAEHITPVQALAHSFERIEVRVWDEKRLGPIRDVELARINDLIERGVIRA